MGGYSTSVMLVLSALGGVFNGVDVISTSHVNVEKEIFDPYGRIGRSIVLLDVHGFKPFRKLVLHYLIDKAHGVCGTPVSGDIVTKLGRHLCSVLTWS